MFSRLALSVGVAVLLLTACSSPERQVPDVTGQPLDQARSALGGAGLEVEVESGGLFGVVDDSGWEVCDQSPEAGSTASKVKVLVERSCTDGAPSTDDASTGDTSTTSAGLTATSAQAACNRQGRIEFPYGFNGHWILGKLAEEILDDRWFFKLEATVENEFGAKRKVNVECFVGGTDALPAVERFLAY